MVAIEKEFIPENMYVCHSLPLNTISLTVAQVSWRLCVSYSNFRQFAWAVHDSDSLVFVKLPDKDFFLVGKIHTMFLCKS